jgi:IS30 family transposase
MLNTGNSRKQICKAIGRDKSVLSRELRRNCDLRSGKYNYDLAQRKYEKRQDEIPKKIHFTSSIQQYVDNLLEKKLSPEQVAGVAKVAGVTCVSPERIYQHVWEDKRKGGSLHVHLRTVGKRYRKRGSAKDCRGIIKDRVSIDERPLVVEAKERIGDIEIDTIIGKDHQGAIVTINDRVTGQLKMQKLSSKNAEELAQATIALLQDWKPHLKTMTADNGKEFAAHKTISKALEIDFYFAHPYHSWERGANENLNGLIRQYIPKKTDFDTLTNDYIKWVENELNNRPRKRHNFRTPNNIYNQFLKMQKVAFVT